MPTIYRCGEIGCAYKSRKVGLIRAHYKKVHEMPWPRDLGLETWSYRPRQWAGMTVKDGGKKPFRNPMKIRPEEIAVMTIGQRMKYQQDMARYAEAVKFRKDTINEFMGDNDTNSVTGSDYGQLPAEVQARLRKLDEIELQQKIEAVLAPLKQKIDEIQDLLRNRPSKETSFFEKFKEFFMTMEMLETLGGSKEADALRYETKQRIESIRHEGVKLMLENNLAAEHLDAAIHRQRVDNLEKAFESQIGLLRQQLLNSRKVRESVADEDALEHIVP
jgi:hypothetical protein